jgi:DNA-binding MarR family transcriptional regulator
MDKPEKNPSGAALVTLIERLTRLLRAAEHGAELIPAQWEALRYLSRANRFSNTPTAITRYLGATKGTISQTVKALERKGYIGKETRADERRSVSLTITPKGEDALKRSSWVALAASADDIKGKTRRRMQKGLEALLAEVVQQGQHPQFGSCPSCRHLEAEKPFCRFFQQQLVQDELELLCVAYAPSDE